METAYIQIICRAFCDQVSWVRCYCPEPESISECLPSEASREMEDGRIGRSGEPEKPAIAL